MEFPSCCCLVNVNKNELCHARKAWFATLVDPHAFSLVGAEPMFTLQTGFKHLVKRGGGREMGLWAPVLLWNPAILLLQNINKSIKIMLILTF
jgi:hypothetical protein